MNLLSTRIAFNRSANLIYAIREDWCFVVTLRRADTFLREYLTISLIHRSHPKRYQNLPGSVAQEKCSSKRRANFGSINSRCPFKKKFKTIRMCRPRNSNGLVTTFQRSTRLPLEHVFALLLLRITTSITFHFRPSDNVHWTRFCSRFVLSSLIERSHQRTGKVTARRTCNSTSFSSDLITIISCEIESLIARSPCDGDQLAPVWKQE